MIKKRILVVDDHAIMREGIRLLLGLQEDIEIIGEASDGFEAIKKVQELTPDVIIMDIAMPNMDGLEAIRRIKKKNPKIRILVLTQHDNKEYVLSAIKAGSSGYVTKSALGSELVSAVRTVYNGEAFLYPTAATALVGGYLHRSEEDPYDSLTNREKEILKLVAEGHTSRQIGELLLLCEKTVTGHRTRLMGKLDLHNRTELVKYAIRKGLAA